MNKPKLIKRLFRNLGFEVRRYQPNEMALRGTLQASMHVARSIGFFPGTVIDIGAARGTWSTAVAQIWEDAHYIMIDPLKENESDLARVCQAIDKAAYKIAAVMEHSGTVTINVHPDMDGSSLFLERETNINGAPRPVKAICLNDLCDELKMVGPFLIKADVQGAEMRVLEGGRSLLPLTEMIVLEVLLFDIFQGDNPQLYDLVSYLKAKGFVAWDIFGMGYRLVDNALCQVDMVFVREESCFRHIQQYATEEQRRSQLARIVATETSRLGKNRL